MRLQVGDRNVIARSVMLATVGLAACEGLPPLDYESEHALVGTTRVDEVCARTLARIDLAIEHIDETLERQTGGQPAEIYVLDRERVYGRCNDVVKGCAYNGRVYITPAGFDDAIVHELVHERIARTPARLSKALFSEGIAEAIGEVRRPPGDDAPRSAVDSYIAAIWSSELSDLSYGYFHAGELVHALMETHGIANVLAFMDEVKWASSVDQIRQKYTAHFGTSIDDDLFARVRTEEELTRTNVVCTGLEVAVDPERRRIHLQADLACDSPRVENHWVSPDKVYVEWVVEIDEDQAGAWAPVRWIGDDMLPSGTLLEIERCRREDRKRRTWSNGRNQPVHLVPGLHRIRWYGPMDGDETLDLELGGRCDEIAQDCQDGERCISPGMCIPSG
ncbi:MAG TPA: hypothetical protein VK034_15610 [Enhygromyxa sp.]|nr:hypothetical protein [Enhygromyxa sp.]